MDNKKTPPPLPTEALKGVMRTDHNSPNPTATQLSRRERNNQWLLSRDLPCFTNLPVVEDDNDVTIRNPSEVARRAIATVICAVKGELQGKDLNTINGLIHQFNAVSFFSKEEQTFILDKAPKEQDLMDFTWRYECVHIFMWALQETDEILPPNAIVDVGSMATIIREKFSPQYIENATLRTPSEILDMADLYYRLHWSAIELRINNNHSNLLHEGIIRERHRALNWLIHYMNQSWDDVSTDT